MRQTLLIFIIFLTIDTYCQGVNKIKVDTTVKDTVVNETGTSLDSLILSVFIKTINPDSLCNPDVFYISFSVDTTGKVIDTDFSVKKYNKPNCSNKTYIEKLKADFESKMPVIKPALLRGKGEHTRYVIPVKFADKSPLNK